MKPAIVVYTKENCVQCTFTKRDMSSKGIDFQEVDITHDDEALSYVKSLGYKSAPVVVYGGVSWSGFNPSQIASLASDLGLTDI